MNGGALVRVALRLAVAALLLWLAVRVALPEGESLGDALRSSWTVPPERIAASFATAFTIFGLGYGVGALRFQLLLAAAGVQLGFGALWRGYVVAGFFNLILPGAIMGDVYRVVDARQDSGRGSEVLGVLVLERMLGLAALAVIGLAALPAVPARNETARLVLPVAAVCGVILAGCLALLHPRVSSLLARRAARLTGPRGIVDRIARSLGALNEASSRPSVVVRASLLSLLTQALPVLAVFALAVPMESSIALPWFAVIVPFVTLATLVPISIGGTGVREILFVALFGAVGMDRGMALSLSLSTLAVALGWGAVGLAVFTWGRSARLDAGVPSDSLR